MPPVLSLIRWDRLCSGTKVCSHRKVHSAPNKLNTVLQQLDPKDRPQISEPTFMESTAAQACVPLMPTPSRPPPQVHQSPVTREPWIIGVLLIYSFILNSQPPKKFSAPPPTSTTEAVSCPFKNLCVAVGIVTICSILIFKLSRIQHFIIPTVRIVSCFDYSTCSSVTHRIKS